MTARPTTWLNVAGAAEVLGVKPATVRRWVFDRRVPFYKVGRLVQFDAAELEEWKRARRVEPDVRFMRDSCQPPVTEAPKRSRGVTSGSAPDQHFRGKDQIRVTP